MKNKLTISILTPTGRYLRTTADYLGVTTTSGAVGILPNHAPLIAKIDISELTIKDEGNVTIYAVSGGLMNVKENSEISLLVNAIERFDEIDISRAESAKKRAEERLEKANENDVMRAKAALARALNRIAVYNSHK